MAVKFVVADASPLIGLAAAEAFDLLRQLFGNVTVTAAVRDEVMVGATLPGAQELTAAVAGGWITVVPDPAGTETFPELGAGEASALALALEHEGVCLVLMDDSLGRARAHASGITVTGVAGVLIAAKRAGLIERVRPGLEELADRDFRIAPEIVRAVLEEAGEA